MRSKDPSTLRIIDVWKFKSTKSNKWYIVEMEHLYNNLIAVKFYYKGVRWSKHRYSLMTNDNEPRTIVYSCFELMKHYYITDDSVSFGFIAAQDIDPVKRSKPVNRRFRFYRILANNFFGPKTFVHMQDQEERLYLLLNRQQLQKGQLSVKDVVENINEIYEGDFNFSWD